MKKILILRVLIGIVGIAIFLYLNNNIIQVTNISIESPKIPKSFSGYRIVQVSDLHSKSFGKNQKDIISKIRSLRPDMIVITGDIIDRRKYNETESLIFVNEAVKVAPVYYCTGNHEAWSGKFKNSLEKKLMNAGATVLRNKASILRRGEDVINIIGVDDPAFNSKSYGEESKDNMYIDKEIKEAIGTVDNSKLNILLSHRPELITIYENNNIDVVFAGHAHGGQIRLPFIGGIIAPNQGFFPKYSAGLYKIKNCNMIVSRGLGNSLFPFRIFNSPNIVLVTLK